MAKVEWDYSDRAAHYDKRADYSESAVLEVLRRMRLDAGQAVADIGAGTGKLTKLLLQAGLVVSCVEPNANMREFGIRNTAGKSATWRDGTGETTTLETASQHATFFGSSFNVVDQARALEECARILKPRGWFCCMWNHRDLGDPLQGAIESIIKRHVPTYDYGKRREDPTSAIDQTGLFGPADHVEGSFVVDMTHAEIIDAWKSHATLARQAGSMFDRVISEIGEYLASMPDPAAVPYTSRIWLAQRRE